MGGTRHFGIAADGDREGGGDTWQCSTGYRECLGSLGPAARLEM